MRKRDIVFFDLDGTLVDTCEGIINSVKIVLEQYNADYSEDHSYHYIGPPLKVMFEECGIDNEQIDNAIKIFRRRYNTLGKYESTPYEEIAGCLQNLKECGYCLYVATSKPEDISRDILEKHRMSGLFYGIYGAIPEKGIMSKADVIKRILCTGVESERVIMVGDTEYDVIGAKQYNIPTIGVGWGYGTHESLKNAGAVTVVDAVGDLNNTINYVSKGEIG